MVFIQFIKKKKVFFIVPLIIILFLIGRALLLKKNNTDMVYTVKQESLVDTVQVSGTYTTAAQTKVMSPAKGIITQLFVINKQEVKKGDLLFRVESTATDEEKAAAFADYQNAVSSLKIAQQNKQVADATMWTKQQSVLDAQNDVNYKNDNTTNPATNDDYTDLEKQSIESSLVQARKDFTAAEQKYKEADIAVSAEQADLTEAQLAYDATKDITVKSPANGTIVNLQKRVGDEVSTDVKNSQSTTGTTSITTSPPPVLVIADLSNPTITAEINEAYIPRLSEGQKARIVFDALKEKTFEGVVEDVDTVGIETNGIVTYQLRIGASGLPPSIRPNMTALITIETLRKDSVLVVPNSAIISQDGKLFVKKVSGDKNELVVVTRGIKGSVKSELTSGLTAGDVIFVNAGIE